MFDELLTTIVRRPYVFAFLAAYLFLAHRLWGWRRTLLWLVSGYLIAWLSEFASINTGFPYGWYFYKYANMPGELMVAGVPFFDSLSYPFLIFAGYATADFLIRGSGIRDQGSGGETCSLFPVPCSLILLGSFLTMLLDVIIDPVAKLGGQWFLGDIYWYEHPGSYFGIPVTNFFGWFLVPLVVIAFNALAWKAFPRLFHRTIGPSDHRTTWLYPLFYTAIALFNIAISFWIGAWHLAFCSSGLLITIMGIVVLRRKRLA